MNKKERLIYTTEQKLLGYTIIFDDRWDHDLALEALMIGGAQERKAFDRWAHQRRGGLEERQRRRGGGPNEKTGYRPVTWLVQEYLFEQSTHPGRTLAELTQEVRETKKGYKDRWYVLLQMLAEGRQERRPAHLVVRSMRDRRWAEQNEHAVFAAGPHGP